MLRKIRHSLAVHRGREKVNRNGGLAIVAGIGADQIELFYIRILDRHATDGDAVAVNEYIAAKVITFAANSIRSVGIINAERQVETAHRIESIDGIDSFRYLAVSELPLGS